jgi:hypothetical protein
LLLAPVLIDLLLSPLEETLVAPNTPAFYWVYSLVTLIHIATFAGWLGILHHHLSKVLADKKQFQCAGTLPQEPSTPQNSEVDTDTLSVWQAFQQALQAFFEGVGRYMPALVQLTLATVGLCILLLVAGATLKGITPATLKTLGSWLVNSLTQWLQWFQLWQENHSQFDAATTKDATKSLLTGLLQQINQAVQTLSPLHQKALQTMGQVTAWSLLTLWLLQQGSLLTTGILTMTQPPEQHPLPRGFYAFFQSLGWMVRYPKPWLVVWMLNMGVGVLGFLLGKLPLLGFILELLFLQWVCVATMVWVALLPPKHSGISSSLGQQVNVEV